jgi:hypothetical protein
MHLIGKEGPMRRQSILLVILAELTACGPWIIKPERSETPETPADASAAGFADERALLAERLELDEQAFLATDDGFVFVVESGDELHLLLSRAGNTEEMEILARVERREIPEETSSVSSHVVACPDGAINVRYYLFGQDTSYRTRRMFGLEAIGGQVVDGLWLMAILDDEIAPDQRWEIRDALGIAPMESGTGAFFLPDSPRGDGPSTLCEAIH